MASLGLKKTVNMVKKTIYSVPEAELLVIQSEGNFLQSLFDKDNNTEIINDDGDEELD